MIYQFNDIIEIGNYVDKTIIFTASNGSGYVENNEITIQNNEYLYEYRKGGWSIAKIENMILYPCGIGAVPALELNNLVVKDSYLWELIKYVPSEQ